MENALADILRQLNVGVQRFNQLISVRIYNINIRYWAMGLIDPDKILLLLTKKIISIVLQDMLI